MPSIRRRTISAAAAAWLAILPAAAPADDCLKTLGATCKQVATDEACTEAHWLDPRLSENDKHKLAAKACRNTRYTTEQWQCVGQEVKGGMAIDAAKRQCGIR